jgi:hypothetical protein
LRGSGDSGDTTALRGWGHAITGDSGRGHPLDRLEHGSGDRRRRGAHGIHPTLARAATAQGFGMSG